MRYTGKDGTVYVIRCDPIPFAEPRHDWYWRAEDLDGPNDHRYGVAETCAQCIKDIREMEE